MSDPNRAALQSAFDRERRDARRAAAADPAAVRTDTIRMYGRLADAMRDVAAQQGVELACERGCAYCCHLRVEVRAHEAFVLADHVAARLVPAVRERVLARVDANLARIAALGPDAHVRAGLACALLEDGACVAYDARPAACRKYHSVAVETCRRAFESPAAPLAGPLDDETLTQAANAVVLGYAQGREDAGLDGTRCELHAALRAALAGPAAEKRYRRGKRAFV